jgi:hypothetical protein
MMTAAKLPATTARRKAAVIAYSMGKPSERPSRTKWLNEAASGRPGTEAQNEPSIERLDAGDTVVDVAHTFGVDRAEAAQ